MEKTPKGYSISHGTKVITLDDLVETLDSLKKYVVDLKVESVPKSKYGSIAKFYEVIKKSKNLIRDYSEEESDLLPVLGEMIFGQGGDKKSQTKKYHQVESLLHSLSDETFENLVDRYVKFPEGSYPNLESLILGGGYAKICPNDGLNGISGEDISFVFNFDSSLGSGLQQRGRGETLFSLAFDTEMNLQAGGDVKCRRNGSIVEIKTTNNAGITPKPGDEENPVYPISPNVVKVLNCIGLKFDIDEVKQGKIQKTSSEEIIKGINNKQEGYLEILNLAEQTFNIDLHCDGEKLICSFLLSQLDYYSKEREEFENLAIFIEESGFPEGIVLIDSNENGFITEPNLQRLKTHKIYPKITSSNRMEIYRFKEKKQKKSSC